MATNGKTARNGGRLTNHLKLSNKANASSLDETIYVNGLGEYYSSPP